MGRLTELKVFRRRNLHKKNRRKPHYQLLLTSTPWWLWTFKIQFYKVQFRTLSWRASVSVLVPIPNLQKLSLWLTLRWCFASGLSLGGWGKAATWLFSFDVELLACLTLLFLLLVRCFLMYSSSSSVSTGKKIMLGVLESVCSLRK